jgi:pimeloyl-ACP methyl ester carboxylesterase
VAWHAAMFRPDVFRAVGGLSVPPPWRGRGRPLETLRKEGIENFYWQYFQTPGVAEAEFEQDVDFTMRAIFSKRSAENGMSQMMHPGFGFLGDRSIPRPLPPWMSEDELALFVTAYRTSGFRGGLNWYRNLDRNWDLTAPWQGARIHQPSIFIAGSTDEVVTGLIGAKRIADMEKVLPNLRQKLVIGGAGHWIQQERATEVNTSLLAFLRGLD